MKFEVTKTQSTYNRYEYDVKLPYKTKRNLGRVVWGVVIVCNVVFWGYTLKSKNSEEE